MLRDLNLQPVYSRDNCADLVGEFFVPTLASAVRYDRATYTFSPEALVVAAAGLAGLINNGGSMRLVCHHQLPKSVVQAIMDGHQAAEDAVVGSLSNRVLAAVDPRDLAAVHHLKLLTWLVKEGRLEIKVAIPRREGGIFHRKVGIFADEHGDTIAFSGSLNESVLGWLYNDESLAVFTSWDSSSHLGQLVEGYERLWSGQADTSIVIPIPEALRRNLMEFAPEEPPSPEELRRYYRDKAKRAALPQQELWTAIGYAIAHDPQTAIQTAAAELWPHQLSFWRRYGREAEAPPRVLIADEVGTREDYPSGRCSQDPHKSGQGGPRPHTDPGSGSMAMATGTAAQVQHRGPGAGPARRTIANGIK